MPTQTTLYWTRAIGLLRNNPRRTKLKRGKRCTTSFRFYGL
jgi:hypothetical protein